MVLAQSVYILSTLPTDNPSGALILIAGSTIAGICSMRLFNRFAPQERLSEIDRLTSTIQRELKNHEGEFSDALPLLRQNLLLSMQRLTLSMVPSLLAALPIMALLALADVSFGNDSIHGLGPSWFRSSVAVCMLFSSVSALVTKFATRTRTTQSSPAS